GGGRRHRGRGRGHRRGRLRSMRFVDTSVWVSLRFRRDRRHPDARQLWEGGTGALLTSTLVMGETWTFLRRRAGHTAAVQFLDAAIRHPALTVTRIDQGLEEEAWKWLRR